MFTEDKVVIGLDTELPSPFAKMTNGEGSL